jgi:hypothetical protein
MVNTLEEGSQPNELLEATWRYVCLAGPALNQPSIRCSFMVIPLVIIFSVLDFLGSGFWEKKNFPEPCATRFFKINEARRIK